MPYNFKCPPFKIGIYTGMQKPHVLKSKTDKTKISMNKKMYKGDKVKRFLVHIPMYMLSFAFAFEMLVNVL